MAAELVETGAEGRLEQPGTCSWRFTPDSLPPGRHEIFASVERFEHRGDPAHLGREHAAEDVDPLRRRAIDQRWGE